MMDDDDRVRPVEAVAVGDDLSRLSVPELEERLKALHGEISRVEREIADKTAFRQAADSVFKGGS